MFHARRRNNAVGKSVGLQGRHHINVRETKVVHRVFLRRTAPFFHGKETAIVTNEYLITAETRRIT